MNQQRKNNVSDLSERQRRDQDLNAHYDLDGVSYEEGNVVLAGDHTHNHSDEKTSSKDFKNKNFQKMEEKKMKDQPEKLDDEKNKDFESEIQKEK